MTAADFKAARLSMGLSTSQLAARFNIAKRTIERIEAGGKITGPMELAILHLLSKHS